MNEHPIVVGKAQVRPADNPDAAWADLGRTIVGIDPASDDPDNPDGMVVGQVTEDGINLSTTKTMTTRSTVADMDALRAYFGMPPHRPVPTYAATLDYLLSPLWRLPPAPRKRKGLTGKRYRIARRQHARLARALRDLPPTSVLAHMPRVMVVADGGDRAFRGLTMRVAPILDEAADFVLPDLRDRVVE